MTRDEMDAHWDAYFKANPPEPLTDEQIVQLRAAFNVRQEPRERKAA